MNKTIVSKGKSVREAVSTALNLLDAVKSDVEIEIIETESKGILGIGSKPAVVRVNLRQFRKAKEPGHNTQLELVKIIENMNIADTPPRIETPFIPPFEHLDERAGKAWVKEGRIFCKNAPDQYPLVSPCEGLKFYQNKLLVETTVVVNENDVLDVEIENEEQDPEWDIKISDDKAEARLEIKPGFRIQRRLKDKEPANHIELSIIETREPCPIETGVVIEALSKNGVIIGIDYMAIARACRSEEPGVFVVARGVQPTPGKHGAFVPIKELEIKKGLKERSDGTIDYREIVEFPSVDRGQVIGVIEPPIPGQPGTTVTGEPVPPMEVFPLRSIAGRGVMVVDQVKVVAIEAGQPDIQLKGLIAKISVLPKLTIPHDIDLKHGNVHYAGDVEVMGTVQDGMLVEAQGNILVDRNVNMAKVVAGNSVIIQKNVITSEVIAGKSGMLEQELSEILGELYEQLSSMMLAMKQIMSISAYKVTPLTKTGLGPLLKLLCNGKFKSFPYLTISFCKKLRLEVSSHALDEEWFFISDKLYNNFITSHLSDIKTLAEFDALMNRIERLLQTSTVNDEGTRCFIRANYVQNSRVYSTGDIQIAGEGVYNSKFYAKGYVQIDGFVRGGEYYAEKGVQIGEAGTKGGFPTKIRVPLGQTISIDRALEDTIIQIGTRAHTFLTETNFVQARLSKEGLLLIH